MSAMDGKRRFARYDVPVPEVRSKVIRWVVALLASQAGQAWAQEPEAEECFDAAVSARITQQVPSVPPGCGDDCIITHWPWFVDLEVQRVLQGEAPTGPLTVLSVQHTYWSSDLGFRRWWLRRNAQGGFNLLGLDEEVMPIRCPEGTAPASAYITPGEGITLEEVRRHGEERYGRRP